MNPLMNKRYIFITAYLFELHLSMLHYELNVYRTGSTQHHVGIGILLHLSNNMGSGTVPSSNESFMLKQE
jgi:hypothetical protein